MHPLITTRTELVSMIAPYAVGIFNTVRGPKCIVAPEVRGDCLLFDAKTLERETIWNGLGGTMNVCQTSPQGEFLAIQQFYKGFNSREALVAKVFRREGSWHCEPFFPLPFLHRFCLVDVAGTRFFLGSTLCADKRSADDWSQPGATYLMRLPQDLSRPGELQVLIPGISKNHGMFRGRRNGRDVVLVSGQEGVFEIRVPGDPDAAWEVEKILDREVSDMTVCDIDGDGVEEMITIEKFHGSRLVVNKPLPNGGWKEIYALPIAFGHALWAGSVLGDPGIIIGYRAANAALLLLRPTGKRGEDLLMDITVLDEHEGSTNLGVVEDGGVCKIFTCSGNRNRVVLYEVKKT